MPTSYMHTRYSFIAGDSCAASGRVATSFLVVDTPFAKTSVGGLCEVLLTALDSLSKTPFGRQVMSSGSSAREDYFLSLGFSHNLSHGVSLMF